MPANGYRGGAEMWDHRTREGARGGLTRISAPWLLELGVTLTPTQNTQATLAVTNLRTDQEQRFVVRLSVCDAAYAQQVWASLPDPCCVHRADELIGETGSVDRHHLDLYHAISLLGLPHPPYDNKRVKKPGTGKTKRAESPTGFVIFATHNIGSVSGNHVWRISRASMFVPVCE